MLSSLPCTKMGAALARPLLIRACLPAFKAQRLPNHLSQSLSNLAAKYLFFYFPSKCLIYNLQPITSCPVPSGDGAQFIPAPFVATFCIIEGCITSLLPSDFQTRQIQLFGAFFSTGCFAALCVLFAALRTLSN